MPHLGLTELIIILVIVLVLFGVGRIGKIAGELGQGIHAFRKGISDDKQQDEVPKVKAAEPADKTAEPEEKAK